ncbi:MAG: hypothetical protein ABI068_04910 [Ktedonobacterales bacterium]
MAEETHFPAASDNLSQQQDWLIGVIDDPQDAERATQALYDAGFAHENVMTLHGPDAVQRLNAKEDQRNVVNKLYSTLTNTLTDAGRFEEDYAAEARAGHTIMNVHVVEPDRIELARQILAAHNAHTIRHYGRWNITGIQNERGS